MDGRALSKIKTVKKRSFLFKRCHWGFLFTVLTFCLLMPSVSLSQKEKVLQTDADTTIQAKEKPAVFKTMFAGKPGKALLYGLIIPGGGQFYNKRYWKVPIVYTAFGVNIYIISQNRAFYKRFDTAFRLRVDFGEPYRDEFSNTLSTESIQSNRKESLKILQQSYFTLGFLYLLSAIEAMVDRHLQSFDINEDLSMRIRPRWVPVGATDVPQAGLAVVFTFK